MVPLLRLRRHVLGGLLLQSIVQEYSIENDGSDGHRAGTEETKAESEDGDENRHYE